MWHKSLPAVHVLTNLDGNQSLSWFGYVSRHIDVCTRGILEIEKWKMSIQIAYIHIIL